MDTLHHPPGFSSTEASAIVRAHYRLDCACARLPSERDQNFVVSVADGGRFVLKIANGAEDRAWLEAQNAAMACAGPTGLCPRVVLSTGGMPIVEVAGASGRHFVRLLTWLPGVPMGVVRHREPRFLEDLGRAVGVIDAAMASFDHPALHRAFHWDLARGLDVVAENAPRIADPGLRAVVERTARVFASETASLLPALPRAAIHNDANDYNVLAERDPSLAWRVTGVLDFGDLVYSIRAAEVAVAAAYAVLDASDPLAVAASVIRGYHREVGLSEPEVAALFGLIRLRLAMSASIAARQMAERPGDDYLAISQAPIARTLPALAAIPARFAEATFRHACGFEPVPAAARLRAWLRQAPFAAVMPGVRGRGDAPRGTSTVVLDLSVSGPLVSGQPFDNAEPLLSRRLVQAMADAGADIGIGRYGEPRLLYSEPAFSGPAAGSERRTIHLGVDLFAPAGTPVCAPAPAVVHTVTVNAAPLDYGPLVILQHEVDDDRFFTLYGHLDAGVVERLAPGRALVAGESFASIGSASVNGGWPPHVHIQTMTDLLDLGGDVPGVCRASEFPIWSELSPDPGPLLSLEEATYDQRTLDPGAALRARDAAIGASLRVGYAHPVQAARGSMQFLYDVTGRRLLDAYNNVPHVGHSHPRVVEAVSRQLRVLNTNTRYLHDSLAAFAERLIRTLPEPLSVCYFVNSGSEANELALRLARAFTGRRALAVLDAAYHGNTTTLIDISPYKFNGPGGQGAPPWVHVLPLPDVYRGEFRGADAGSRYARQVRETLTGTLGEGAGRLCGFIAETCPSVAGQIMLPAGYLEDVYRTVRGAGGLCIADEVQTAYGRIGTHFYAFEAHGVVPDIVVLGKPIGNGMPLGAVVTTRAVARAFDNGMEFFSTFGGSTASCAAGLAVLDVVEDERLQAHACRVGQRLLSGLEELQRVHAVIGDVRGSGLFIGVDLVLDRDARRPAPVHASYIVNRMREEGVLAGTDGPFHNVLKIRPPMPFDERDADRLLAVLAAVLDELRVGDEGAPGDGAILPAGER